MSAVPSKRGCKRDWHSPPQIAQSRGIDANKVVGWIKSGELKAINAATSLGGRPRYLVSDTALDDFDRRRAVIPPAPSAPRRRRRADSAVKEFY
jgi:hypothetical protein